MIIFTVLFFIVMAICLIGFGNVSRMVNYNSLSGRQEAMDLDIKMSGPDTILDTLVFDKDYEEEFDEYWEFAKVRQAYIMGRVADDKTDSISIISDYANSNAKKTWRDAANRYLEKLQ